MRKLAAVVAAGTVAAVLSAVGAAPGRAAPGELAATVRPVAATSTLRTFPVYDPTGARKPDASWRVTTAGGNCCEVFVDATSTGRLLEFGGTYPTYSDDRGVTWHEVRPQTPLLGGEGAITSAPNGDVLGVGWDPYSGDHLQSFKYTAATRTWSYSEIVVHNPFYDRPWIAVVPGPFRRPDGTTAPYATVVRSNYLSTVYDLFYVSYDGVTYLPTTDEAASLTGSAAQGYLEPARVPAMDYMQPHPMIRVTPLARGGLFNVAPARRTSSCPTTVLGTDTTWRCHTMPGHTFGNNLHVDSRGWLHEVVQVNASRFRYGQSADGGRTWQTTDLGVPGGGTVTSPNLVDFKANGALGVAIVAVHADIGTTSQDLVYRLDVSTAAPRLLETMYVGDGNRKTQVGLGAPQRFDFASVALLPDGTIAVAFDDASNPSPVLAVQERPSPVSAPPPPAPPAPPASPGPTPPPPPLDTSGPGASVVAPRGLTDPAVVRFDEPVNGVTTDNVTLRRGSTVVPTTARCRDAGGSAVSCAALVTAVDLLPAAPLRPGERYAAVVNPDGTPPVRDSAGNAGVPATLPFRASTTEAEASAAAAYAWGVVRDGAAYGGSYHLEHRAGATLRHPFTGGTVTWYAATGPAHGRVQVLVDGVDRGTVDTYSATRRHRVPYTVSGVGDGPHVLTLRVRGDRSARASGTRVAVDAVKAGVLTATPSWGAAWARAAAPSFAGGAAAVSDVAGAQVTFAFRGTGAAWVTSTAPNAGRAGVYVDGRLHAVVDNYSASRRYGVRRWVTGLSDGVHRITVRALGTKSSSSTGTAVAVDGWLVR